LFRVKVLPGSTVSFPLRVTLNPELTVTTALLISRKEHAAKSAPMVAVEPSKITDLPALGAPLDHVSPPLLEVVESIETMAEPEFPVPVQPPVLVTETKVYVVVAVGETEILEPDT